MAALSAALSAAVSSLCLRRASAASAVRKKMRTLVSLTSSDEAAGAKTGLGGVWAAAGATASAKIITIFIQSVGLGTTPGNMTGAIICGLSLKCNDNSAVMAPRAQN
jgi:hypothetical protein